MGGDSKSEVVNGVRIGRTGRFLSDGERSAALEKYGESCGPFLGATTEDTRRAAEVIDQARYEYHRIVDDGAVALGLAPPEKDADGNVVHYGVDFRTGEVLVFLGHE